MTDIKAIRDKLNYSQDELAALLGVSTRTIQNWEAGKVIPKSKLPMLRQLEANATYKEEDDSTDAKIGFETGVPYFDEDFVLGFSEIGFPSSEKPQYLVQMPKYSNATLWCNATGHSMEPEINSGDVIALQLIEDPSFLLMGELYAIVTKNGLRTIKRLGRGCDDDHYRLIPTNKDYDEQEIPKKMILRVFRVLGNLHSF